MSDVDRHIVEANMMRPVRIFSAAELPVTEPFDVVASDCFPKNVDLPDPGSRVTIAAGDSVIRGTVTDIVFLLQVDRDG